jgi:hypothetical protein
LFLWAGAPRLAPQGKHAAFFASEGLDRGFCGVVQIDRVCGVIMEDETPGDPGLQECGNELEDCPCKAGKISIQERRQ